MKGMMRSKRKRRMRMMKNMMEKMKSKRVNNLKMKQKVTVCMKVKRMSNHMKIIAYKMRITTTLKVMAKILMKIPTF